MKKVLITGIAGFIGFHVAQKLKKEGHFVIGIDNFNPYYDPFLKEKRAKILISQNIVVIRLDIQEKEKILKILKDHEITDIIHLAAQAGVRHSLKCPDDYVESNLKGFVSIMETCKQFPEIKCIFASSSSVYGANKKTPFSVEDSTDSPTNLYGATKKANELIANAYHHLFGIPCIGLRFFTVYGPFGRPDMAYFSFTESILNDKEISLFNRGKMKRDFTYIDDIVEGIYQSLYYPAGYEIFNLGNNNPVDILSFIKILEKLLNKKAKIKLLPNQKSEVIETFADIEKSRKKLNFYPKTSLEKGLENFVSWYKDFSKKP